jgi:hypothetical protein
MGAIPPGVFAATKLAVRRPMLEAAREQSAKTNAKVLEHWLSPETLAGVAKFVEQTIKRKG